MRPCALNESCLIMNGEVEGYVIVQLGLRPGDLIKYRHCWNFEQLKENIPGNTMDNISQEDAGHVFRLHTVPIPIYSLLTNTSSLRVNPYAAGG